MEQADDVVIFSTSLAGLQRKLDEFSRWCSDNCMTISVAKTKWMCFGPHPMHPFLRINGELLELVSEYKHVGIIFRSTGSDIFEAHYQAKSAKAQAVGAVTFTLQSFIGDLLPPEGVHMYMARVDPHLTFGCEVSLDTCPTGIELYEKVQKRYLRWLLGLPDRSPRAPLFTETGLAPIRHRRAILALSYLQYLLALPEEQYASLACRDSMELMGAGHPSWHGDLAIVLQELSVPVEACEADFTRAESVKKLVESVNSSMERGLERDVHATERLLPLDGRLVAVDGQPRYQMGKVKLYLKVPDAPNRKHVARIMTGCHRLAMQGMQYGNTGDEYTKTCRMCGKESKDPQHILEKCSDVTLKELRDELKDDVSKIELGNYVSQSKGWVLQMLRADSQMLVNRISRYVSNVMDMVESTPEHAA
jgi:hypothetical protein